MSNDKPILVTGAAGRVGGVGRAVVEALRRRGLPDHVYEHLLIMAQLHAAGRYDRLTHDVEAITGRPATGIRDYVAQHSYLFG
jgi:NAD(P)-dependent dehydrogenase (short-subunit alcohol dehydrogenase family)